MIENPHDDDNLLHCYICKRNNIEVKFIIPQTCREYFQYESRKIVKINKTEYYGYNGEGDVTVIFNSNLEYMRSELDGYKGEFASCCVYCDDCWDDLKISKCPYCKKKYKLDCIQDDENFYAKKYVKNYYEEYLKNIVKLFEEVLNSDISSIINEYLIYIGTLENDIDLEEILEIISKNN